MNELPTSSPQNSREHESSPLTGTIAIGLVAAGLAVFAPWILDRGVFVHSLLSDRVAECASRHDGATGFVTSILERERFHFIANLRTVGSALAIGFWSTALLKKFARTPFAIAPAILPFAIAAVVAVAFEFGNQIVLATNGARDGLFSEDRSARDRRSFDAALAPSKTVTERTPETARIVVIDFSDPQVVKKFGYLVYPRRVFMPPRIDFRFSAEQVRKILKEMPHGIDWCFDAGYTHLVDLRTLELANDPSAIIDLRELPR